MTLLRIILLIVGGLFVACLKAQVSPSGNDSIPKTLTSDQKLELYLSLASKYQESDPATSLSYMERAAEEVETMSDSLQLAKVWAAKARLLNAVGYVGDLLPFSEQQLHTTRYYGSAADLVVSLLLEARTMNVRRNPVKALNYIDEAIGVAALIQDPSLRDGSEAGILYLKAEILNQTGRFNDALAAIDKAMDIATHFPDGSLILSMVVFQTQILVNLEWYDQASVAMDQANSLMELTQPDVGAIINYLEISAALLYHREFHDEALQRLKEAWAKARDAGHQYAQEKLADSLASYYLKLKMPDSALSWMNEAAQLERTTTSLTSRIVLSLLNSESALQKKASDLMEAEEHQRRSYMTIGYILITLILFLLLLWYLLRRRRMYQALLRLGQDEEKAKKMYEGEQSKQLIAGQNRELLTHLMTQMRQQELINEVVDEVNNHRKELGVKKTKEIVDSLSNLTDKSSGKAADDFISAFKASNVEFINKLHLASNNLSKKELMLSAFLYLGMSTKEISQITLGSPRSIDVARTRLRKKLNIDDPSISFTQYFNSL